METFIGRGIAGVQAPAAVTVNADIAKAASAADFAGYLDDFEAGAAKAAASKAEKPRANSGWDLGLSLGLFKNNGTQYECLVKDCKAGGQRKNDGKAGDGATSALEHFFLHHLEKLPAELLAERLRDTRLAFAHAIKDVKLVCDERAVPHEQFLKLRARLAADGGVVEPQVPGGT